MNKDDNSKEIQYITFKGEKNGFILKPFKNKVGQAAIDHLKESKDDEKQKIRRDFNDRFAGEILNEIMHGEEYKNLRNKINKKEKK